MRGNNPSSEVFEKDGGNGSQDTRRGRWEEEEEIQEDREHE